MISKLVDSERAVADVFNSAIAAAAIGAAWEVGFLDAVRDQKKVDITSYARKHDLDVDSLQGVVTSLAIVDILGREEAEDKIVLAVPGNLLEEAYRTKSMFHWLSLGSGGLFSRMQYVLRNENRHGDFYDRDSVAIGYACYDINKHHFDPAFWAAVKGLDYKFQSIVDLGSGSGERLMQLLTRYPGTKGLGVDIAGPALGDAARRAKERGFANRLSFTEGDATALSYREEFANVDLLTCFMMGHDFWPRENCVNTLQRLRKAFPNVQRFLLGDTTRILLDSPDSRFAVTEDNVPTFTLGFELGHALMGVYLPTMEEWEGVFNEGGWRCVKSHILKSPSHSVIFELEHLMTQ
ncbi:hypothetical protein F66182_3271 [Fusarium sp. NRRL 66182]|nr:hypothetical protein F66182_3271 [Fusarium sp. NRRL 66182]